MNDKALLLLPIIVIMFLLPTLAAATNETCVYFFYGNGCPHCAHVDPVIDALIQERPDTTIIRYEVYKNRSNAQTLNALFTAYDVKMDARGVPALFVGDSYLVGDKPIIENLDRLVEEKRGSSCPGIVANPSGIIGEKSPAEKLGSLSLVTVIGAALVDSINPCAIAVILILLGALIATGQRRRALIAGLAFTASIYIAYLLFGLGLFSALQVSGLAYWFAKTVGVLAIVIGLMNIKDYFWYGGGGFVMEIPRAWRPSIKKLLGAVTSPIGAFAAGFAVCLFELPCTGGPYLFILGLLADKTTMLAALPILLLYNLFFILPLLLLTILVCSGFASVERATAWKENNLRLLHLVAGIIMLLLGVVVVAGWL
jgi:cytochrome c biogenesis protein CcdA